MNRILITMMCLILSVPVLAAEGFSSLEEQMTGKEFNAAGLEKLSPQELDALNAWIRKHSLATLATTSSRATATTTAGTSDDRGLKSDKGEEDTSTVTSKLIGTFNGWDGQTIFKLENGMIWAQDSKKKFHTKEIKNPTVVIEHGMFGRWHLSVEGLDEKCKVKRIQ